MSNTSSESSFPLAEVTLDENYNACSMAAAELNKRVHTIFESTSPESMALYEITPEGVHVLQQKVIWLTDVIESSAGRHFSLALTKDAQRPDDQRAQLVAVTRGDISFPLAAFTRRPGQFQCDYVQFGDQMHTDMVVVPDDDSKRFEQIDAIRTLLAEENIFFAGQKAFQVASIVQESMNTARPNEIAELFKKERSGPSYAYRYKKTAIGIGALTILAVENDIFIIKGGYDNSFGEWTNHLPNGRKRKFSNIGDGLVFVDISTKHYLDRYYNKYTKFINRNGFSDVRTCKIPGAQHEIGQALLNIIIAKKQYGERYEHLGSVSGGHIVQRVAEALNVVSLLDAQLGPVQPEGERLTYMLSRIIGRTALETEVQAKNGMNYVTTDVRIEVDGSGLERRVSYFVRPDSMDDSDFTLAGVFHFNRAQPVAVDKDVTSELLRVISHAAEDRGV